MIKIAPNTLRIEASFKNAIKQMYEGYLNNIDIASYGNADRRSMLLADNPDASRRALDAVRGVNEARRGLSYEYARFQIAAEYTRLYSLEHNNVIWLMGDTKPVMITGINCSNNRMQTWNIGSYAVAFKLQSLIDASGNIQHFIPLSAPLTTERHPHHYGRHPDREHPERTVNPLDMEESTCWGGFATGIRYAISERDFAGLYSIMFKYLSRYDSHSVLGRRVEDTRWMLDHDNKQKSK